MADFQANISEFDNRNIQVIAFSVDSKEDAQESIENLGLTFPVGYGLDHIAFAEATGAFYEVRRSIIHATEFILKKDGSILGSVFSSGPAGRYDVNAALRVVDFAISQAAK
ncbi:MAG: peroxiredoxin [Cellvibrionaceae bacterium]